MVSNKVLFIIFALVFVSHLLFGQKAKQKYYWELSSSGSIIWKLDKWESGQHSDNIEMSGKRVSAIIYYDINEHKELSIKRDIFFPQMRVYNKSNEPEWKKHRAYRRLTFSSEIEPNITIDSLTLIFAKTDSVKINGKLIFYHSPVEGLALRRTLFPCMDNALFVEHWELINITKISKSLKIGNSGFTSLLPGYKGIYTNQVYSDAATEVSLNPAESYHFTIYFSAAINEDPTKEFNYKDIEKGRDVFLKTIKENLVLETSNPVIDQLFYFSKIRASESIFESKMGLVHSPGGGNYYAGIWANDQVEYSGPFFPFLGDEAGIEAAKNAYLMFLRNIPASSEPIFSSFEIEGELPCCGKDRGDAAMIAYGTSQFLLRYASRDFAMHLWPLIEWSIDYCQNKINEDGVVLSKTDEMEGRISTGDANLSTNALYYGGLINASFLAKELGKDNLSKLYEKRSIEMSKNIEKHFGFKIEGLDTYRYFEGNTHLRHWICLPLVMGIDERAEATAEALLDKLWTENGVLVELNPASTKPDVFWDRGTLYALRGTFKAGFFDKSLKKLVEYSNKRLLGDHVPYAIEAYPENNMKHLSAESALYCRVILEGILGFEQTAFDEFSIVPQLSEELSKLKLSNLHIGDNSITIELLLAKEKVQAKISVDGKKKRKGVYNIGEIISVKI